MSNKLSERIDFSNSEVKFIIGKVRREANLMKGQHTRNLYIIQENMHNKFVDRFALFDYDVAKEFCEKLNNGFKQNWVRVLNKPIKLIF